MAKRKSEFVRWMGPILDALRTLGGSGKPQEVLDLVAERNSLTRELEATLKSGQTRFYNQVHWARQYLVWDGLIDGSIRGVWSLTQRGNNIVLDDDTAWKIANKWSKVHADAKRKSEVGDEQDTSPTDSEISIDDDYRYLLLELLKKITPKGFESICARLLRESGFEKVNVTGGPKDEGIDGVGVLQINPFVSFKVLFQCKRYKGAVSRAQVAEFRNSMIGRADKGIIMTTGSFTSDARKEAERDGAPPVELVDGDRLVEMFERVGLGLRQRTVYELDHAFFAGYLPIES